MSVGDIVILKEGTLRSEWRLGRVLQTLPSEDGLVRKVRIQVGRVGEAFSSTTLERPISKLVVLMEA